MTNYEKKLRKIAEHNEKIMTEHFHLDNEKFIKQHGTAKVTIVGVYTARILR